MLVSDFSPAADILEMLERLQKEFRQRPTPKKRAALKPADAKKAQIRIRGER
jgi:hypothetical protein